eukprot:GEMP01056067.1.p1 GENE.GEMP01056067.1~~GEMP01056067.1.p1  ORF type:complete len:314 (-),score=47.92 GEMP01056067.1:515-1456(-)
MKLIALTVFSAQVAAGCSNKIKDDGSAWTIATEIKDIRHNCTHFERFPNFCSTQGEIRGDDGASANDACCVCGGGSKACLQYATRYFGDDLHDVQTNSWGECAIECAQLGDCWFWTWAKDKKTCYLKNANSGKADFHVNRISGSKSCAPSAGDCLQHETRYFGNDIRDVQVNSWAECTFECAQLDGCEFWTWAKDQNTCYLKDANSGNSDSLVDRISGSKSCAFDAVDCKNVALGDECAACGGHADEACLTRHMYGTCDSNGKKCLGPTVSAHVIAASVMGAVVGMIALIGILYWCCARKIRGATGNPQQQEV